MNHTKQRREEPGYRSYDFNGQGQTQTQGQGQGERRGRSPPPQSPSAAAGPSADYAAPSPSGRDEAPRDDRGYDAYSNQRPGWEQ